MRIFVTAGNTQVPIDRVRCITNIFTGRTGAAIALEAFRRGHDVTLATSHPEVIAVNPDPTHWRCQPYRTFDELDALMEREIATKPDAIVHCAAVADYFAAGVFAAERVGSAMRMHDRSAGKVKSDEPELWLRLVRAPKLVDKIRKEWGHHGLLVKFKLEVGVSDEELLEIAEKSRCHSDANWMVANTLESSADWALLGNSDGYRKMTRDELPGALLDEIEAKEIRHA